MKNFDLILELIPKELLNTVYMTFVSTFFSFLIGLMIGIKLYLSKSEGLKQNRLIYQGLSLFVNVGRSIPFAILMISIIPLTRFIVGTSIGTTASIVPLTLAGIPLMARFVEIAFNKIDKELIDTSLVMGATNSQIIKQVLLPESLPTLVQGITLTSVNLANS